MSQRIHQIKIKLTSLEQQNLKVVQNLQTSYSSLESQVKYIIFELNAAQMMANQVIEKTEKKIMETQQIKVKQNIQFDELSKNLNIQKNLEQTNTNIQQLTMSSQILNQKCQSFQDLIQHQFQNQCQLSEEKVYKTETGENYHKEGCKTMQKYPREMLTKKQALSDGLIGCKICKS